MVPSCPHCGEMMVRTDSTADDSVSHTQRWHCPNCGIETHITFARVAADEISEMLKAQANKNGE